MPYKIIKLKSNRYKVVNKDTGQIKAKNSTLKKAKAQIRLLLYIDSNKKSNNKI